MQFRCPNCRQAIRVGETDLLEGSAGREATVDSVECPSCHSRFSLSLDADATTIPTQGLKIGHFEVLALIGEGAFGTVYRAWDPELERNVALKLPRQGRITKDTSSMFLREARAAAGISHPHVVSVYEVGIHDDRYYIATEYIEGITFAEFLRSRTMEPGNAARFMICLLRAVQLFHDKGIIHRDLKPGNILLDANNEPHIADFGLARQEGPSELTVTQSGRIVGTLHYMSPEQARGESRLLTCRSDLYALGVILYQMLCGQRPFEASTSQTLLHVIQTKEPRSLRKLRPSVPGDLETICLKALEKSPEKRYPSASEMADDLQRFLDQRPILARRATPFERSVKWIRRNPAATVIICLSILVGALMIPLFSPPAADGYLSVLVQTNPAADAIELVRYDDSLRVPHPGGNRVQSTSGQTLRLLPGLYRVIAATSDGHFHEVWRTVPESTSQVSMKPWFPHLNWKVDEQKNIVLPEFHLFLDRDLEDPVVNIPGGIFAAGYDAQQLAPVHSHNVNDLMVGVNEVSYGRFRKVMDRPIPDRSNSATWLQVLQERFGDRSAIPDDQPVSGFPIDVAILYCELCGGRLPTGIEYEYVATRRGSSNFPTGDEPAVNDVTAWTVLAVTDPTPDTSPEGIRNLYFGVAEYTDSVAVTYKYLYPELFPTATQAGIATLSRAELELVGQKREIRGAPVNWVWQQDGPNQMNVRQRLSLKLLPTADSDFASVHSRIGWRIVRSDQPTLKSMDSDASFSGSTKLRRQPKSRAQYLNPNR